MTTDTDNSGVLLIGDVGGTNARFAIASEEAPSFSQVQVLECADFASADDAIQHYLQGICAELPAGICLAVAGPVVDERVRFTNNSWTLAVKDLQGSFGIDKVLLLNDFEAIAHALPEFGDADLMSVGLPEPKPLDVDHFKVGVIGPGTGLGAVGLCKHGGQLIPISGEASHGGFAPETKTQFDILGVLRDQFERVSSERLVSGPGIENLYWALAQLHGENSRSLSAAEIFKADLAASDPRASEAVELFFEILGQVAGDFALALGANDGMYIAGGIAQRYPEKLANSRFRTGFERKGRYRSLMERIPTQLIAHPQPGLLGAACRILQ